MTELAALSRAPLWVMGGEQRSLGALTPEWKTFRQAVIVKVDGARTTRVLEYVSPPQHCPDDTPSILFKAATIAGADAYLCTQTEVLVCDFPSFSIRRVISHPCFNDVHHVAVAPDGRLFVAVTGLDAVAELSPNGDLLHLTSVNDDSPWTRFSPELDYRKRATTKPHQSHPNYVFFLDGEPWVTRFEQRDAVPLYGDRGSRRAFHVTEERIHDGNLVGGQLYFTAVDGRIIRFEVDSGRRTEFDLNKMRGNDGGRPLGWCRGLLPLGQFAWVGFSRLRQPALRRNLRWVRHGFKANDRAQAQPTRIACYDLDRAALIAEVGLEDAGLAAVFSIHAAADRPRETGDGA